MGGFYAPQLRITALRGMLRLKLRPKIDLSDPVKNFVGWSRNFEWFVDAVLRPLERALGIGADGGGSSSSSSSSSHDGVGSSGSGGGGGGGESSSDAVMRAPAALAPRRESSSGAHAAGTDAAAAAPGGGGGGGGASGACFLGTGWQPRGADAAYVLRFALPSTHTHRRSTQKNPRCNKKGEMKKYWRDKKTEGPKQYQKIGKYFVHGFNSRGAVARSCRFFRRRTTDTRSCC